MSNILYAEDDRDCRELFAFALRQNNYKVHEARNGAQAVQIVREEPIDLVILDTRMPMMTGYDAARTIATEAPDLPIIFLSAKGLREEVAKGFDSSPMVIDYLIKPILPQQLVNYVGDILAACRLRGTETIRTENRTRELMAER
jgi:CheY-like chemotaxis protein